MIKVFCRACGGEHEPDLDDSYAIFRGYKFTKPFLCICCGKEICLRQFAFGRACGACDMGACQSDNKAWNIQKAHAHPEWWHFDGQEIFKRFVEHTKATPESERAG